MGRSFHRKTPKVSVAALENAMKAIAAGMKVKTAADHFNVPRTTLRRRVESPMKKHCMQVFDKTQEEAILKYVLRSCARSLGPTTTGVRSLVFEYATKQNLQVPPNWIEHSMAGVEWLRGFIKRHPKLSLKKKHGKWRVCAVPTNEDKADEESDESDEDEDDEGDDDAADSDSDEESMDES